MNVFHIKLSNVLKQSFNPWYFIHGGYIALTLKTKKKISIQLSGRFHSTKFIKKKKNSIAAEMHMWNLCLVQHSFVIFFFYFSWLGLFFSASASFVKFYLQRNQWFIFPYFSTLPLSLSRSGNISIMDNHCLKEKKKNKIKKKLSIVSISSHSPLCVLNNRFEKKKLSRKSIFT